MNSLLSGVLARLAGEGGLCLNCGKNPAPVGPICDSCVASAARLLDHLKTGLTLEYDDGSTETLILPKADCFNCLYKNLGEAGVGHCYMFKDKPGACCAQFEARSKNAGYKTVDSA